MKRLRLILTFLLLGLVTTLAVAWLMTLLVDVQQGRQLQADAFTDDDQWSVTRWDRAGAIQIKSTHVKGLSWSPMKAAGKPDVNRYADDTHAWASQTQDGSPEWLILEYDTAAIPRRVDVYENYCPGALSKVTVFDANDKEIDAWSGTDPSAGANTLSVSKIPISLNIPTKKIKLYIDSQNVPGWNEIDAAGLISDKNETQWARRVRASSTYAAASGRGNTGISPNQLLPYWTTLDRHVDPDSNEDRMVDARGWPMVALMSHVDLLAPSRSGRPAAATPSGYGGSGALPDSGAVSGLATSGSLTPLALGPQGSSFALNTPVPGNVPVPIPFHPVWIGLIGDTLIYATLWLGLWSVLVIPRRFVRELARFRSGACIRCGYDLGYDFIKGCPECGWRRDRQPS
jgi:hypothetical protein